MFSLLTPVSAICSEENKMEKRHALSQRQQGIIPIAAFTADGDMDRLKPALNQGLDAGLTVNEIKEVLVHLYAYTGFPRSLNALSALTVTWSLYKKMLAALPESMFNVDGEWTVVRKKVRRSAQAWGESK
jgi:alkylhydroperoxidase/carboxymuconolactone decarboxylase family protein YurZ